MKMRISTLLVVLMSLVLGTTACNQQSEANNQKQTILWYEMMAIHDEVMPKTSEINRLSRNLKSMEANVPDIFESQYKLALDKLEKADESMMTWMGELQQLEEMRKNMKHEKIMEYLYQEKNKVEQVKKDMLGSIGNAELIKVQITQYKN